MAPRKATTTRRPVKGDTELGLERALKVARQREAIVDDDAAAVEFARTLARRLDRGVRPGARDGANALAMLAREYRLALTACGLTPAARLEREGQVVGPDALDVLLAELTYPPVGPTDN